MKNFQITSVEDGKKYWISRSCAVTGIIIRRIDTTNYILAVKRGSGTPDFQGHWCMPCGYIDFDESGEEAVTREVLEEAGIQLEPENFTLYGVETNPQANLQNITLRYIAFLDNEITYVKSEGGEENEIADVKWISTEDINNYKWAFGHENIIKNIFHL